MFELDIIDENQHRKRIKCYRLVVNVRNVPVAIGLILDKNTGEFVVSHAGEEDFQKIMQHLNIPAGNIKLYGIEDNARNDDVISVPKLKIVREIGG